MITENARKELTRKKEVFAAPFFSLQYGNGLSFV